MDAMQSSSDETSGLPKQAEKGCKVKAKTRFVRMLQADLTARINNRIPANTKKNTNWAIKTWNTWADWRNGEQEGDIPVIPKDESIGKLLDSNFGQLLSLFVTEVTRQDGDYYPLNTLYNICCGLNRYVTQVVVSLK